MSKKGFVAFDLGAESGRTMLAVLENDQLSLEEISRFANLPQRIPSGYHWSLIELWRHLLEGLSAAGQHARQNDIKLVSLGVDTWGLDYALVGKSGQLLGLPYCYRDTRTEGMMQAAFDKVGEKHIYDATGIQFMPINTLYQLFAQQQAEPMVLEQAQHLLTMPDLLHFFFSNKPINEATIASTTQMIDPRSGDWNRQLLSALDLPSHFLGPITPAGTVIGQVRAEIAQQAGIDPIDVIVPGAHDTASAVAAVPVDTSTAKSWAYLSSGTWSLMGAELDQPIISEQAHRSGFTNERGVADKIRFLKNIVGLWLVQQVRADLSRRGKNYDYAALTSLAAEAEPFVTLVDVGHVPFAAPGDMCAKIDHFAGATGQPRPANPGQYVRCCLESLAMAYRDTFNKLEELLEYKIEQLHIVGGGGRNRLLNQMTADAINRRVVVGPFEATAIGNALTQAIGSGDLRDLDHLRQVVRNSFELQTFAPIDAGAFDEQFERFVKLVSPPV